MSSPTGGRTSEAGRRSSSATTHPAITVSRTRRADLDGLRAFAIVLVVVYHVWLGRVSGGVDVFLLVSAYFLTASFLPRLDGLRLASLPAFWSRRFAQLLPAAALTVVGVLGFTALALPSSQWSGLWQQAWASVFYTQNVALADASVDYYARTEVFPSPLQHFWSLSVQGQVFVLWPVLILAAVLLARAMRRSATTVLTVLFAVVFLVSFAYSVHLTSTDQQVAYFSTGARLWEFALGSLAALVLPRIRVSAAVGMVLGWAGVLALVACGLVLDVGTGFPGVAALWPTLAAIAVIAAGQAERPRGASAFLAARPLRALGGISYALYLVHWPILIAAMVILDSTRIGPVEGAVVIALSVVVAWSLTRAVAAFSGRIGVSVRRDTRLIVAALLVVAVPLGAWQTAEAVRTAVADPQANPGARVLMPWTGARAEADAPLVPRGTSLEEEWVALDGPCEGRYRLDDEEFADTCVQSIVGPDAPTFVAVGDSHAQQWLGAFIPVLEDAGWNVVALLKGGCSLGPDEDAEDECRAWRAGAAAYVETRSFDVAMFVGTKAVPDAPDERLPAGLDRVVEAVAASGTEVLLVRDNPRFREDMFACLEQRGEECARPASDVLAAENPSLPLSDDPRVSVVDLSPYLCPESLCLPAIGNVAVYMDDNHLSGTYARSLAPAVQAALAQIPGIPIG